MTNIIIFPHAKKNDPKHFAARWSIIFFRGKWRVALSSEPRANKRFEKVTTTPKSVCNLQRPYVYLGCEFTSFHRQHMCLSFQKSPHCSLLAFEMEGEEVEAALASDQISMMFGRVPVSLWWIIISPRWPYGAEASGRDLKSLICCPRNSQMCLWLWGVRMQN